LKIRFAPVAALIVLAVETAYAKDPALLSLPMEHFRDTATVKEDPQGASTTISTENGFVEHRGPLRMVWNDEFLTSIIDGKTGQKSFQVNSWIIYSGKWRSYERADYQAANGRKSVPAISIGKETANCAVGDCTYTERFAFAVDEDLLRRLAAQDAPGRPVMWRYKFIAKSGPEFEGGFSSAEIAGFLAKVDEVSGVLPAVGAKASIASLKRRLGIGGLAVAATADHTNRAGVLITGVDEGSIAQKTGLIVGDILYEFDGRPIKTLAELQAAVAACTADSQVPVKLYRGTNPMAATAQF
jgi:hypothetical protein